MGEEPRGVIVRRGWRRGRLSRAGARRCGPGARRSGTLSRAPPPLRPQQAARGRSRPHKAGQRQRRPRPPRAVTEGPESGPRAPPPAPSRPRAGKLRRDSERRRGRAGPPAAAPANFGKRRRGPSRSVPHKGAGPPRSPRAPRDPSLRSPPGRRRRLGARMGRAGVSVPGPVRGRPAAAGGRPGAAESFGWAAVTDAETEFPLFPRRQELAGPPAPGPGPGPPAPGCHRAPGPPRPAEPPPPAEPRPVPGAGAAPGSAPLPDTAPGGRGQGRREPGAPAAARPRGAAPTRGPSRSTHVGTAKPGDTRQGHPLWNSHPGTPTQGCPTRHCTSSFPLAECCSWAPRGYRCLWAGDRDEDRSCGARCG